jgi:hypothetical protein
MGLRRTSAVALAVSAGLFLASGPATAQEKEGLEVSGKVVDAAGKPVAGADVADFYAAEGDRVYAFDGSKTGADGTFRLTVKNYGRAFALVAYDAERKRSGMARLGPEGSKEPLVLSLAPVFRVHGRFTCKALGGKPEWTMVYAYTFDGKVRIAQCDSTEAEFSLLLPQGAWSLNMYGTDIRSIDRTVEPKKGKLDLDLGAVEMEATFLAVHYGKPLPPWTVSDARGVRRETQLSDYKGRWVLVEFWGYW